VLQNRHNRDSFYTDNIKRRKTMVIKVFKLVYLTVFETLKKRSGRYVLIKKACTTKREREREGVGCLQIKLAQ